MRKTSQLGERLRHVPPVFRISAAILFAALIVGQLTRHRPAGDWTNKLLVTSARLCPSATYRGKRPTIADGANLLDRAIYRMVADRYAPVSRPRCRLR